MIDKNKCIACGSCVSVCPVNAIEFEADGKPQIIKEKCIKCGSCVAICPTQAITINDDKESKKLT
ncbi:MAG: 4Fe-4S binding protein [Clostridia bacterium]|jgi:NAD-dependent dihydropyrimidine dehydrogenase PreA subunit|nr:4Fe-4S binding protein [Clostridia bacterium]MDD3231808.1 4Fe-4S binding protein [Clostridia bacterium]MDD3862585.1 4Fe-4S binding protein [Clostridia bacterium]MDD4408734.1 4Fe-4S binding protein [Clostridia bacterium]